MICQSISWTVRTITRRTRRETQGRPNITSTPQDQGRQDQALAPVLPVRAQAHSLGQDHVQAQGTVALDQTVARGHAHTVGAKGPVQPAEAKGQGQMVKGNAQGPGKLRVQGTW